jgi:phosphate transport system substrate-binding protein
MKNTLYRLTLGAFVVAGALTARTAWAETLVLQGSTDFTSLVMEPYKADIEAAAGVELVVLPNKSNLGLLALLEGQADLAMISAPLDKRIEVLRETRPELPYQLLQRFLIIRSRVAFPVHPSNPVRSLPLTKIRQILRGNISNWREVGGPDLPIRVVSMRDADGVRRTIEVSLLKGDSIAPREHRFVEDGSHVIKAVAQDPSALGITQLSEARRSRIPELRTDGLLKQDLFFVTLGEPSDATKAVIAATRRVLFDEEP